MAAVSPRPGGVVPPECLISDVRRAGDFHSLRIRLLDGSKVIDTPWVNASADPYARLATLLWILKPVDVI